MSFKIREYAGGTVTVIDIPERLTVDTADQLRRQLKELVEKGNVKLVMNLEKTAYMDSSGLGAVVSQIAVARSKTGDIRLASVQKYIEYLLNLTHLNKILKCYDSVESAVKNFEE